VRTVAVDVGGTHARFALADCAPGARPQLGPTCRYRTSEHPDLPSAWRRFASDAGEPLPDAVSLAVAAPLGEQVLRFANSSWSIDTRTLKNDLGVSEVVLINDFGAMAHAVAMFGQDELLPIHGPLGPLPDDGVITVMGPGTGLGVAILRRRGPDYFVIETEGSHIAFAALDAGDSAIVRELQAKFGRVSLERVVSGPGLVNVAQALAAAEGTEQEIGDSGSWWSAALDGSNALAVRSLDRLVMAFGAAAGDLALAHGSSAVVLTGGLSNKLIERLRGPLFLDRFCDKGRYRGRMERISIKVATHAEAGLLGAAIAFQREHAG
jgi:glucokinase